MLVFRRSHHQAAGFEVAVELGRGDTPASAQLTGFELAIDDLFRPG